MDPAEIFNAECEANAKAMSADPEFAALSREWVSASFRRKYMYNFRWLGRPIIQSPVDIVAMQEILHSVKPDLVVETGIAHGGSLILSASILELNRICGGPADPLVLGIDIDIRAHNRDAIQAHPLSGRIRTIQGSSIDPAVVAQVRGIAAERKRVVVVLDSNHTHEHVLAELEAYAGLASPGSYCVVFDTLVEHVPAELSSDRPWGPGNNPLTAVREFLASHPEFKVDRGFEAKLAISSGPGGFLRRRTEGPGA